MSCNIKLTIGIPTYNGAQGIPRTIESILAQIQHIDQHAVEILISDNASQDNTREIIEKYISLHPALFSYYRNTENVGYDDNVDLVVKRAVGKYVWLLGCGEIIKDGALKLILSKLDNNIFDSVLLNFDIYSERKNIIEEGNNFGIFKDKMFHARDDFFAATKFGITPLSANIILKESWMRVSGNEPVAPDWVHVQRIMDLMSHSAYRETLQISTLCFTLYRERDGWWDRNGNFLLKAIKLLKIINAMKDNNTYDEKTIRMLFDETYKNLHKLIRWSKRSGLEVNSNVLVDAVKLFYNRFSFWFYHLPFLLIPTFIFNNVIVKRISHVPRDTYRYFKRLIV